MKRIASFLMAVSVLLSVSLPVFAHDVPVDRTDCSIEVVVRYDGSNVNGGTLTAIKVGYVAEEDGNYFFCQEMTGTRLDDIGSPDAPKVQQEFYEANKSNYAFHTQTQPVQDGKAIFSGLPTGLYLIVQNDAAPGFSKLGDFLVSVPLMQNGAYQYHVTAAIKSELERESVPTDPPPAVPEDPKLPQTGQLNWPVPLLAIAGLAFWVVGWQLCFGKQKDRYEN